MSSIDFVIVTKNQVEYTRQCIESILAHTKQPFRLILVDNASTDGTRQYYEELKSNLPASAAISLILNEANVGYVLGVNQGLKMASAPYVFLCNNDIIFYPKAVAEMIRISELDPRFGLVNPNSNEFGFGDYSKSKVESLSGSCRERCHISGFCALLKREVIEKVGFYDEAYSPGYFEEMDYSERAKRARFLCAVAEGAYVYHYGSRSFLPKEKQEAWAKNRKLFVEKWGGTKWFCYLADSESMSDGSKRTAVIEQLLEVARQNIAVVHIFVPKGSAKYFQGRHDSFRLVQVPVPFLTFAFLGKAWRSFASKPISRVYVSSKNHSKWLDRLEPFHHAEVKVLL